MAENQEREAFDERHSSEAVEIIVLTGENVGGAGKAGGDVLWTPTSNVLAYIDETGSAVFEEGRLSWLATNEQRGSWVHDLKPLAQYRVRARRRAAPDPEEYTRIGLPVPDLSHHFALVEVLERDLHVRELDERLGRWRHPVSISTHFGEFELDRSFGWFSGTVQWGGREVSVMLAIDEGSAEGAETCHGALSRLTEFVASMPSMDVRWREYAASELTDLANDWQQEDEAQSAEPITADVFAQRIRLSELSIAADGSATPYYDDGDLFWGHVIVIDVEVDGALTDASIAG